jgi:iron-sulfur cluster repair protein YtfE (RIC family)
MCHYCGCRQVSLIRDYFAEHERALEHADAAVRAMDRQDFEVAREEVAEMTKELTSHWIGEENGIFRVMRREDLYAAHIEPLIQEHRELAALLAEADVTDAGFQERFRAALDDLYVHISKEEDGLFPVSLVDFSGPDWDQAIDAWHVAHPGDDLIPD